MHSFNAKIKFSREVSTYLLRSLSDLILTSKTAAAVDLYFARLHKVHTAAAGVWFTLELHNGAYLRTFGDFF